MKLRIIYTYDIMNILILPQFIVKWIKSHYATNIVQFSTRFECAVHTDSHCPQFTVSI